jgi:endonuclease YncB( thermonuclease family)
VTAIPARVLQVHDGDTLEVSVTVRLADCNARELDEPGGVEARDHLRALLPVGTRVQLYPTTVDHYHNRMDAGVRAWRTDVVEYLATHQWVARYPGHGPKVNPPWPRTVA